MRSRVFVLEMDRYDVAYLARMLEGPRGDRMIERHTGRRYKDRPSMIEEGRRVLKQIKRCVMNLDELARKAGIDDHMNPVEVQSTVDFSKPQYAWRRRQ